MDHKGLQQGNDTMLHSWSFPVAPYPSSHAMCRLSNFDIAMSHANTRTQDPSPLNADRKTHTRHLFFFFFFYLTGKNIQSICVRLNPNTHWLVQNWLWCVPLLVWLYYVCVCVFWALSYRAGRLEQMVSSLLKGWGGGDLGLWQCGTAQGRAGCFSVWGQSTNGHLQKNTGRSYQ